MRYEVWRKTVKDTFGFRFRIRTNVVFILSIGAVIGVSGSDVEQFPQENSRPKEL